MTDVSSLREVKGGRKEREGEDINYEKEGRKEEVQGEPSKDARKKNLIGVHIRHLINEITDKCQNLDHYSAVESIVCHLLL